MREGKERKKRRKLRGQFRGAGLLGYDSLISSLWGNAFTESLKTSSVFHSLLFPDLRKSKSIGRRLKKGYLRVKEPPGRSLVGDTVKIPVHEKGISLG